MKTEIQVSYCSTDKNLRDLVPAYLSSSTISKVYPVEYQSWVSVEKTKNKKQKTKLFDGQRNLENASNSNHPHTSLCAPKPWQGRTLRRLLSNPCCLTLFSSLSHKFIWPQKAFFLHLNLFHTDTFRNVTLALPSPSFRHNELVS